MGRPALSEKEKSLREIESRLGANIKRVEILVEFYEVLIKREGKGRQPVHATDLLRAAMVLLHAALEECLRNLQIICFPHKDKTELNQIPLLDERRRKRPSEFKLGDLADHAGMSVDDLIKKSIERHFESYGSISAVGDIENAIRLCEVAKFDYDYKLLAKLIDRRHQIVHKADINKSVKGKGNHKVQAINEADVRQVLAEVTKFASSLMAAIRALPAAKV